MVTGGKFNLETHGDGSAYTNTSNETDYYTSRCLLSKGNMTITSCEMECLSTGIGGKGIDCGADLTIGSFKSALNDQININVTTMGTCVVDDVDEDMRFGCPKGIKGDRIVYIYGGNIHVETQGMGGEGIESVKEMYVYDGNIECNCFDDGINVGEKLEILGGKIYCNSKDNDGIDSNGSIYIRGGIVASVNQKEPNESFDTEQRQFYIFGGTVIGVGSCSVKMDKQEVLYYNTLFNVDPDKPARRGLRLTNGKYVYVMDGDELLLSIKNDNLARRGFVTVALPAFVENCSYSIYQGDEPISTENALFGRKLFFKGESINKEHVIDIQPKYNYND